MNSISGVGSSAMMQAMRLQGGNPPSHAEMSKAAFGAIDQSGKGYLDKSDIEAASKNSPLGQMMGASGLSPDKLMSKLDTNGDSQITQSEFSDGMSSILEHLQGQMQGARAPQSSGAVLGNRPTTSTQSMLLDLVNGLKDDGKTKSDGKITDATATDSTDRLQSRLVQKLNAYLHASTDPSAASATVAATA